MHNFPDILIKNNATLIESLVAIERGGCRTAFVVDENRTLLAAVTDGDIRRALIQGEELSARVGCVANHRPFSVKRGYEMGAVRRTLQQRVMNAVPVTDDKGVVVDVLRLNDMVDGVNDTPVVIMAGGLGKRLGALCADTPKPMLRIAGEPILHHIITNLMRYGLTNFYISVNHMSEVIENYFGDGSNLGCSIRYLHESKRLGTGGAIGLLKGVVDTEFLVVNGDILTRANLLNMLSYHMDNGFDMTIGTVDHTVSLDYGVLDVDGGVVRGLREKPVMNYKINGGIYCLSPKLIERVPKDEYFEMTRFLTMPISVGGYSITDYWIDIGRLPQFETAERDFDRIFGAN